MKIIVNNSVSQVAVGGKDNLLDYNVMKELREYFSTEVKGAYFSDKYRSHVWDGRKYYITEAGKLPTGFIPYLFNWLESRPEIEVEVIDNRTNVQPFIFPPVTTASEITLRPYQEDAVMALNRYITFREYSLYFPMGVFDIATNGGKTIIDYFIFRNIKDCNMIITIHTKDVFRQLVKELSEFGEKVGVINDRKVDLQRITVAMVGTLFNRMKQSVEFRKKLQQFNTLIVEEGHACGAKQYAWVLKTLDSPGVRIVVSGTPLSQADETKSLTVAGLGSNVICTISKKFLMDMGVSQKANVYIHLNDIDINTDGMDYDDVYTVVIKESTTRAKTIRSLVLSNPQKFILIMAFELTHIQFLYDYLKDIEGVEMVHGQDPDREVKLDMFRTGETRVLIASEIVKIGLNMPLINMLIPVMGEKAEIDILQFSGRGERNDGVFTDFEIHDFYDVGRYVEQHSLERIRIYRRVEFPVTFMYPSSKVGKPKNI